MSSVDRFIRGIKSVPLVQPTWRMLRTRFLGPHRTQIYSIGQYSGVDPLLVTSNRSDNPILSSHDVTDVDAEFIADPFLIRSEAMWTLFFEVLPKSRGGRVQPGVIAFATSEDEGTTWKYRQVVLREKFHLSYPLVLHDGNEYFMIPESQESNEVRLYRAAPFPTRWEYVTTLLRGDFTDATPFYFNDSWWMIAESVTKGSRFTGKVSNSTLRLYYADKLYGPWSEHPQSPIVSGDQRTARPAGRVLIPGPNSNPVRFSQDCRVAYGAAVYAFEILHLTRNAYAEREVGAQPLLSASGQGWNADGMHHIDVQKVGETWIAFVDGWHYLNRTPQRSSR